jgi:hypothetical protein
MRLESWQLTIQEKVSCCRKCSCTPHTGFSSFFSTLQSQAGGFFAFLPANWNHLKVVFVIKDVGSSQMML